MHCLPFSQGRLLDMCQSVLEVLLTLYLYDQVKCDLESKSNNCCSACERRKQVCRFVLKINWVLTNHVLTWVSTTSPRRTAVLRESRRKAASLSPEEHLMGLPRDTFTVTNSLESAQSLAAATRLASAQMN